MWKTILDIFLPINCLGCGQPGQFICPVCFKKMPLNKDQPLKFGQKFFLTGLIIASHYNSPLVKEAIHRYKYSFIKDLAEPLGKLMTKKLSFCLAIPKKESLLIPVSLHQRRLRWRGFNQAELLAEVISQELNIPLANNLLIRTKYTRPQVKILNAEQRKENIRRNFQLNWPSQIDLKNKTIILVDDVATTGATLEESAKALRPLRPKEIWGLVVARG